MAIGKVTQEGEEDGEIKEHELTEAIHNLNSQRSANDQQPS